MLKISAYLLGAMVTLMIGFFTWSSVTLVEVDKKIELLTKDMGHYVKTLEIYATNQYTKQQAESDKKLIYKEIEILNKRIDGLDK